MLIQAEAGDMIAALRKRGYHPVPVDMSEFRKSGGGPKCCTLEIRGLPSVSAMGVGA